MKFILPDINIEVNLDLKTRFEKVKYIKSILIMILAYWIDISETRKTYYKKVYDPDLERARLINVRKFANPRLINFLLLTRQDSRRLNEINDSLYGALEHGIIYESNNPYACPRILSIGHSFSHFDSKIDDTEGLGNPNKAHFLLDILILHAVKPFDEIEIGIIKTLIKSRIAIFLSNDYRIELFELDRWNNVKRLREMFLISLTIELIADLTDLSSQLSFKIHTTKFKNALKHRIYSYSNFDHLKNYDFSDFMNVFISSIRIGGGYRKTYLLKLRKLINLLSKSNSDFEQIKQIINLTDKDPFNVEYIESVVMPKLDIFLNSKLADYYFKKPK